MVNVITRVPETNYLRFRTAFGSFGTQQQRVDLGWVNRRWAQRVLLSRDFSTGFLPNRDYRNTSISADSHIQTKLGATALLFAHADRPFGAERFYGDYPSWERTKSWWASLRQEFGSRTQAVLGFRRGSDLFVLYRYEPQRYTNRHTGESYQAALRRNDSVLRIFTLHYGAEVYRDQLASTNLGLRARDRGAAFFGVDARAVRRFSFTAGAREDIYTGGGRQFSPTLAAAYWALARAKLRGSASHGFRLPSFTELYYRDPANIGNPLLRPERAWNYEGGLDWNAGARLRGSHTLFERRESNGIDYVRQNRSDAWRAENFNRLRFNGAEFAIVWSWRQQRFDVQHTWLRGSQTVLRGLVSKYVFNYPSANTVAAWQGELHRELLGRVRLARVDRVRREPYTVVDVYLSRRSALFSPFVQLSNAAATSYEEIPGVPAPGRAALFGVELRIQR